MAPRFPIHKYPKLESLVPKKKNDLSEKEIFDRVLKAVMLHKQTNGVKKNLYIELERTKENGLDICARNEILTALERINTASLATGFKSVLNLSDANYQVRRLKGEITEDADGILHAKADLVTPSETHPLYFNFFPPFDSWYALYQYKKEITLAKLSPLNLERIYGTVLAIDEQLQMNMSPALTIYPINGSQTQDYLSRKNAFEFLKQKKVVSDFKGTFASGVGWFEVSLDVAEFLKFKDEIEGFWNAHYSREKSHVVWPENLKWEEVTIKFQNGHEVTIEARETKYRTDFKEMGFRSKKDNLPNQQWEFLKLLSESEGKVTWDNSQADASLKKKKQLLSTGLKEFFKIETDPFEVYQQAKAYKAKFIIIPE